MKQLLIASISKMRYIVNNSFVILSKKMEW